MDRFCTDKTEKWPLTTKPKTHRPGVLGRSLTPAGDGRDTHQTNSRNSQTTVYGHLKQAVPYPVGMSVAGVARILVRHTG